MSKALAHYERFIILYAVLGLGLGLGLGVALPLTRAIAGLLAFIVGTYDYAAPFVLYLILAPSLLKMVQQRGASGAWFSIYVTFWFAKIRIFACLFAVLAVSIIYGLAPFGKVGQHDSNAALGALAAFARVATQSRYFFAIYAAIATVVLLRRREGPLVERFTAVPELVERFGKLFTRVVPVFTFLMGTYVATLPVVLAEALRDYKGVSFGVIELFGLDLDVTSPRGVLVVYVIIALLTGVVCMIWHLGLLSYLKLRQPEFSFGVYFRGYFSKLYPLLWATCSEALGTPLNMHLVKETYPRVDASVRHLAISTGTVFGVNGTLTCCFVMIPVVCRMLHIDVSGFSLLLCLPVIYIVGFGIPGIPGELVLFAGPIMGMLGIPVELRPAFLIVFIGLQIGLPDSFRSGANATEGCPAALLLNEIYHRDFAHKLMPAGDGAVAAKDSNS